MAARKPRSDGHSRPAPPPGGRSGIGGNAARHRKPPEASQAPPPSRPPTIPFFDSEIKEVILAAVVAAQLPKFSDLVKRKLVDGGGKGKEERGQERNMRQVFDRLCSHRTIKDAEDINAWLQRREREIKTDLQDFKAYDFPDRKTSAENSNSENSSQIPPSPEETELLLAQAREFVVTSARQYVDYVRSSLKEGSPQTSRLMKLIQNDLFNTLENIDFDYKLSVQEVKKVVNRMDAYTPHLVAPEKAIRSLIHDCIVLAVKPIETCVWNVHDALEVLLNEAHFECGYMRFPKMYIKFQDEVHKLGKGWRESAVELARELVVVEGIYPTHISLKQEEAAEPNETAPSSPSTDVQKPSRKNSIRREKSDLTRNSSETQSEDSPESAAVDRSASQRLSESLGSTFHADPSSILSGWFDKKSSEGKAWQRRYFVLDEEKAILYYNLKPEEKVIRGRINLSNLVQVQAKVQDRDEREADDTTFRLHSRTNEPLVNNHLWIMLRAESPAMKYEWLARLRAAAVPPHAGLRDSAPPPSASIESDGQQSPYSGDSGEEGPEEPEIETDLPFQSTKSMPRLLDEDGKIEFFANTVRSYVKDVIAELNILIPKTIVFIMLRRCQQDLLPKLNSLLSQIPERELLTLVRNDSMAEEWRTGAEDALGKIAQGRKEMSQLCTKGFLEFVNNKRQDIARKRNMVRTGSMARR